MKITLALLLCLSLVGCNFMGLSKFVTSGQNADNVPVFSQVIHGNSLKPLSPVNVRGYRDAANNLSIEWTRRSRIGAGLRPNTGIPIGEENDTFDIDVFASTVSSSVVRTIHVVDPAPQPVPWYSDGVYQKTALTFGPKDSYFEALVNFDDGSGGIAGSSSVDFSFAGLYSTLDGWDIRLSGDAVSQWVGITIREITSGVPVTLYSGHTPGILTVDFVQKFRVRFSIENGQPRFYVPWDGSGAPTALGASLNPYNVGPMITTADEANALYSGAVIRRGLSAYYPASEQTANGLTPGNPIKLRLYEVSAVVGRGGYAEVIL